MRVKREIDDGNVGGVELIRVTARDAVSHNKMSYLTSSGSYFFDSLIHDIDICRCYLEQEPIEVYVAYFFS